MCRPEKINCFKCEKWFNKKMGEECKICGEFKCPYCKSCLCDMSNETKKAVIAMIRTYEEYLTNLYEVEPYDFSKHINIIK